ncbi:MAG: cytochrome P450 [Actinomycetota bacterium]
MSSLPAGTSIAGLAADPHPIFHHLRTNEPVAWIESLEAWLVTSHDLCVDVMLDPATFTVDNPRFSTQRVIGPSMLSLDGAEHRRHRDPFAGPFRAAKVKELSEFTDRTAGNLIDGVAQRGAGDLRADVAGPLAVAVMAQILDLRDVSVSDVLTWYEEIVAAVHAVTAGEDVPDSGLEAFEELKEAVVRGRSDSALLHPVEETGTLSVDEIVSNVAVLLFGGIVTSESATAIAYRYLLDNPRLWDRLVDEPAAIGPFVEETFRLEPSASAVDRYATRDVRLGGADIAKGDLVRVSLGAANRDPAVFEEPDRLSVDRSNLGQSVTFARGPHACLGIHLARLEAVAAIKAVLAHPDLQPVERLPIEGLLFRVPDAVPVRSARPSP